MKVVKSEQKTVVDMRTGEEVQTETTNVFYLPQEPPFVKMYVQDLCSIKGVAEADCAVLRHLLSRLDFEGYVIVSSRIISTIVASLGITTKTFRNRISNLIKADMIRRVAQNEFEVNPTYFAKGEWKKIWKMRNKYRIQITYSEKDGRTFSSEEIEE